MLGPSERKPWAVLAYTVADDKGSGDSLDAAAKEELKSLCDAADFGQMSVAAQVDFKHTRGVFRGVLTEAPPKTRGFEAIPADSHPLWRGIKARLDRSKLRVLKDQADLNAARADVLESFLRFGQRECPADRYVVFFYGHGYGPLGLFFDAESDDASARSTMPLTSLSDSLHTVGERAAVIVFRACQATRSRPPTSCATRASSCSRRSRSCRLPASGRGARSSRSLMPAPRRATSARAIARAAGALPRRRPRNRDPFADVPVFADRSRRGERDRRAAEGARRRARRGAGRPGAPGRLRGGPRSGAHRLSRRPPTPGDPALLDVPTMCDNLAGLDRDPVAAPARRARRGRRTAARDVASLAAGPAPRHRPVLQAGERGARQAVAPVRGRHGRSGRRALRAAGPEPGDRLGPDRAQSAAVKQDEAHEACAGRRLPRASHG